MMIVAATISTILYLAVSLILIRRWTEVEHDPRLFIATCFATLAHSIYTIERSFTHDGIDLSLVSASNFIALALALMAIITSALRPIQKLTLPLLLLAALNIVASFFITTPNTVKPFSVASHILPSLLAYSIFSFAAVHACVLWFQDRALKTQQLNKLINSLPPLDILESALFIILSTGFLLLTTAIVTGTVFIDHFWAQGLAHKTFFTCLAWLIFGTLLAGRRLGHWRGNSAIQWTLSGYALLVLGFFGSKFVIEFVIN